MADQDPRIADVDAKPPRWVRFPWVTVGLSAVMVWAFFCEVRAFRWDIIDQLLRDYGFFWGVFAEHPIQEAPSLISYLFLHQDEIHLGGNLAFFLIFGLPMEKYIGHIPLLAGFLFWGAASAVIQGLLEPYTALSIGASGAISGVAGAYFVLVPIRMRGWTVRGVVGFLFVGLWFLLQIQGGLAYLKPLFVLSQPVRVAFWAHVAGFTVGAVSMLPYLFPKRRVPGS